MLWFFAQREGPIHVREFPGSTALPQRFCNNCQASAPWLMELGQWVRAEYNATDQRIPERLAALLEESLRVAVPECPANVAATVTTSVPHGLIHAAPAGPSPESTSPLKRRTKVTLARGLCLAI